MAFATTLRFEDVGRSWADPPVRLTPVRVVGRRPDPQGPGGGRRWWRAGLVVVVVASLLALAPAAVEVLAPEPGGELPAVGAEVEATLGSTPLAFVENRGQVEGPVTYYVQGATTSLYFTPDGVTYALSDGTEAAQRWAVKVDFVGANAVTPTGVERAEGVVSYFGDDARTAIPTFSSIVYEDLWPGIDMVYEGTGSALKYSFVVHPGADPAQIRLAYHGASGVTLNDAGQIDVTTPAGGFTDDTPYSYQDIDGTRVEVPSQYALEPGAAAGDATVGIPVGDYDTTQDLVIDPTVLVYAGYIGGAGSDTGTDIAVDAAGNAYVTGGTSSGPDSFPVTVGPDLTLDGNGDAFVAKVRADGTGLVYAGYIGGDGGDFASGIAVDGTGAAYITGSTTSSAATFPLAGGLDATRDGGNDVFVAKINAAGTGLEYAGYIGGSGGEAAHGIAIDDAGNAYVGGTTNSTEATFPVTVGPDLSYNGDNADAFVAKVDPTGSALVYAGYIGGSAFEYSVDGSGDIAVDDAGNAYLIGWSNHTTDGSFPVRTGPNLTQGGGPYIAKIDASGAELVYAGYLPGAPMGIDVDDQGSAYVVGIASERFPATVGPDLTYNGFMNDGYIAKLTPDGTGFVYAGFIGSDSVEQAHDVVVDDAGAAYVTGVVGITSTFPTEGGFDPNHNGASDAFVVKVTPPGTGFEWGTFLGGSGDDRGNAIALDDAGNVFVTGFTNSNRSRGRTGFPATVGPDLTYNGSRHDFRDAAGQQDAFVAMISQTGEP